MKKEALKQLFDLLQQAEEADEFVIYLQEAEGPVLIHKIELVGDDKEGFFVMVTIT